MIRYCFHILVFFNNIDYECISQNICEENTANYLDYEFETNFHCIYTGDKDEEFIKKEKILVLDLPASGKWVKKKVNKNCISKHENDCMVDVYEEIPARQEYMEIWVVSDTSKVKAFAPFLYKKITKMDSISHWEMQEIVCPNELNEKLLDKILDQLIIWGFATKYKRKEYPILKQLYYLQLHNYMPYGNVNLATLGALGIN